MTACTDTIREIDSRTNAGISVKLSGYFDSAGQCAYAIVEVESPDESFRLSEIPLDKALDVWHHPFFYANRALTSGRIAA